MKFSVWTAVALCGFFSPLSAQIIQSEPNDSFGTATPSTLVAGSSGWVTSIGNNGDGPFGPATGDSSGDFDFFSVEANAGQVIIFDVNSSILNTGVDTVIGIYNEAAELLASSDDDGFSRDSFVRYPVTEDGTYYLVLGSWVPSAANDAGSLPLNPAVAGTGRGAPGAAVGSYEVVILLDGAVYLSYGRPVIPVTDRDGVSQGEFVLKNNGDSVATITNLDLIGPGAGVFSIDQALPMSIAAGATETVSVSFEPGGSDEVFTATIVVGSDDVVYPTINIPVAAKAINGVLFRIPFDDPAGSPVNQYATPAETSGNNYTAAMVVNAGATLPEYGRPPLAGNEGFSTMFHDSGGSGNYVFTLDDFPNTPSFTYSLWVRPIAGVGEDTLFNRDPAFSFGDNIFGCTIREDGELVFRINGADIVSSGPGAVLDDSVYHVVVTHYDSTGFGDFSAERTRLYLNGVMVDENTATLEIPEYNGGSNSKLWIATRSAAGTGFNGEMDDFQLYIVELDPTEVAELYDYPGTLLGEAPREPFEITKFSRSADGKTVNLTFNSRPNRTYILEASSDLKIWGEVDDSVESDGVSTTISFSDSFVFGLETARIYFRLVEVP